MPFKTLDFKLPTMTRSFSASSEEGLKQVAAIIRDAAALASSANQVKVRGDKVIRMINSFENMDVAQLSAKDKTKLDNLLMELRTKLSILKEDVAHSSSNLPTPQDVRNLFKTD